MRNLQGVDTMILVLSGFGIFMGAAIAYTIYDYATAPDEGTVVDSYHTEMMVTTSCSGNPPICTNTVHPEQWTLRIQNGDDEGPVDVSEDVYEECTLGDWYPECVQD